MKNAEVAHAWSQGEPAEAAHLTTRDGRNLYSYALRIGYTDADGARVAIDHTTTGGSFYSMTTSRHVSHAKHYADRIQPAQEATQ